MLKLQVDGLWTQSDPLRYVAVQLFKQPLTRLSRRIGARNSDFVASIADRYPQSVLNQLEMGVKMPAKQCNMLRVFRF